MPLISLTQLKLVYNLLLYNNQHIIFYSLKWCIAFNKRVATVFRSWYNNSRIYIINTHINTKINSLIFPTESIIIRIIIIIYNGICQPSSTYIIEYRSKYLLSTQNICVVCRQRSEGVSSIMSHNIYTKNVMIHYPNPSH